MVPHDTRQVGNQRSAVGVLGFRVLRFLVLGFRALRFLVLGLGVWGQSATPLELQTLARR